MLLALWLNLMDWIGRLPEKQTSYVVVYQLAGKKMHETFNMSRDQRTKSGKVVQATLNGTTHTRHAWLNLSLQRRTT